VTFSVRADGTLPFSYQWFKDGAVIAGATAATYCIGGVLGADGGNYYAIVSNQAGSVTSDYATLSVTAAPVALGFTSQPSSQSAAAGATVTFSVAACGSPAPMCQWQVSTDDGSTWTSLTDIAPYGGTATATLTITAVMVGMNGYEYRCVASNSAQGSVTSNAVVSMITPPTVMPDSAGDVLSNGFTAAWNAVRGATGYRLDVSTESSFSSYVSGYQNLDVGNVTSMTLDCLGADTTYYYRVRAYDSAGAGASSSAITVTTSASINVPALFAFSTLAGEALCSGRNDGMCGAARFSNPSGTAADNAGNLYVADTDNHTIRKIVASTGAVTTLAGLAGTSGSADGSGSTARFNNPSGLTVDGAGNVYVADTMNNTLRKVTASGVVSTLAGLPGTAGNADGAGSAALFMGPQGLAIDGRGNLYVADTNNHTIRKVVLSTCQVTTVAGLAGNPGSTDGVGSQGRFNFPEGVAVDGAGNIYVADAENQTIRKISSSGLVSTVAGLAGSSGGADGTGSSARFNAPSAVAMDAAGNVYVADTDNFTVRKVAPATGAVTTLAGLAGISGSADGVGSAVRFLHPAGIAMDSNSLYLADTNNDTVRVAQMPSVPVIQTQPQSQTVTAGNSVQFSVVASGYPAVTYQWCFNGTAIAGATGGAYSLSGAQSGNAGNYAVIVSNVMGSVTSNQATLTVNSAALPAIVANGGDGPGGGGGGGGAPGIWFFIALLLIAAARKSQRFAREKGHPDSASV
jgi:sugar lactone lactonase YvrE